MISEETRKKLSDAQKKRWADPAARAKHSARFSGAGNPFFGRQHSAEFKERMSEQKAALTGESNPFFGKKHHEATKQKMRKAHPSAQGKKSFRWITDRTKLARASEYRNNYAHQEWTKNVKNRDGWKCKIANSDCCGKLEAHHILGWRSHPELRYTITNGITLCHFHHPRVRKEEKRLAPYFQELVSVSEVIN